MICLTDPPQVEVPQSKYTVNEDDDLTVECKVDANPPASIIWRPVSRRETYPNIKYDSNYIIIQRINRRMNQAEFECIAQNEHGTSQPAIIKLDVLCE